MTGVRAWFRRHRFMVALWSAGAGYIGANAGVVYLSWTAF